jgi:hypothetical protein
MVSYGRVSDRYFYSQWSLGGMTPLTNRNAKAPYNPPNDSHKDRVLLGNHVRGSEKYNNYWSHKARMKEPVEISSVPLEFSLPGVTGGSTGHQLGELARWL